MMTETAHTPGPWIAHMADNSSCECREILTELYAGGIATIHVDNGIISLAEGGNDSPPLGEAQANARLISKAPELLAENERLRGVLERWRVGIIKLIAEIEGDE